MNFKIKKGLDVPLKGRPDNRIDSVHPASKAAVLGADYIDLRPTMLVREGDAVKIGTPLFEDKKNPGVVITSPASGTVHSINRGAKRALISVEIECQGDAAESFSVHLGQQIDAPSLRSLLQKSGLWVAFRTRPYGKVPTVDSLPNSIFVNAMDSNPLAADPQFIIDEQASTFVHGMVALSCLGVPVYLCKERSAKLPDISRSGAKTVSFSGPHPAGLSSTHIHYVDPVNANKTVWTIGYQDVIAMGELLQKGRLSNTRHVAVAGPLVNSPRVFAVHAGACISELLDGRLTEGHVRVISGSVLNGHVAHGHTDFLGRYDNQISVIPEPDEREFMGWLAPGSRKFSALNVFLSSLFRPNAYTISTSQYGSARAIVPIGVFEQIMPLDILPTPLIKSLLVKDTVDAQRKGCLELVEEDMALLSFVDPGKHDFAPVLRNALRQIEREG